MRIAAFILAVAVIAPGGAYAGAFEAALPGAQPDLPAPRPVPKDKPAAPYAMNYSDEVAQSLGIKNGRLDLFTARPATPNGLAPTLTGGVDGQGAMVKLQWHPGE